MRAVIWLVALGAMAAAVALFVGDNQAMVTLFWSPYRVDLSLNMVLLLLAGGFFALHTALRTLQTLLDLPRQARRWRLQQKERAMHASLLEALSHLVAGRFLRARKSAELAIDQEHNLAGDDALPPYLNQLRAMAHMVVAESAQALQDRLARDAHLRAALNAAAEGRGPASQEIREGLLMRKATWALRDVDPDTALEVLAQLPAGVTRRTLALRIRLKAARQAHRTLEALETTRLLAKHRAFSPLAAQSMVRGLATELLRSAHDLGQLQRAWQQLDPAERVMPELAISAAQRLIALGGDSSQARQWLLPVWDALFHHAEARVAQPGVALVQALQACLPGLDAQWLARFENAHQLQPNDAQLQYLAGMACRERQLWGKAQQHLSQAVSGLEDASLARMAWRTLAEMAEHSGNDLQALQAWKAAARR